VSRSTPPVLQATSGGRPRLPVGRRLRSLEFLTALPKEILGMIVERCEVSRKVFTTLLLLNKQTISPVVWGHFRFPAGWDWKNFVDRVAYQQTFRKTTWTHAIWQLYGFSYSVDLFRSVSTLCSQHIVDSFWVNRDKRSILNTDVCYRNVTWANDPLSICKTLSRLFQMFRPDYDISMICKLFTMLGHEIDGTIDNSLSDVPVIRAVPDCLASLEEPISKRSHRPWLLQRLPRVCRARLRDYPARD
jgi:hypothetical protein